MLTTMPASPVPTKRAASENREALHAAIRDYVDAHRRRHGQKRTAENLGVSRHTLWRYLEHGHSGHAVPAAVLDSVGQSVREVEAATLEIIIDLEGLRPDPALRLLRRGQEDALMLLCATSRPRWTNWPAPAAFPLPPSKSARRLTAPGRTDCR